MYVLSSSYNCKLLLNKIITKNNDKHKIHKPFTNYN